MTFLLLRHPLGECVKSVHRQSLARVHRALINEYLAAPNVTHRELDVAGAFPRLSGPPAFAESFGAIVDSMQCLSSTFLARAIYTATSLPIDG